MLQAWLQSLSRGCCLPSAVQHTPYFEINKCHALQQGRINGQVASTSTDSHAPSSKPKMAYRRWLLHIIIIPVVVVPARVEIQGVKVALGIPRNSAHIGVNDGPKMRRVRPSLVHSNK